jgi:predicted TIM-barrel fold metal-dependent hydrolase
MVIDTHTHAWGAPTYDHPWVNETHARLSREFAVDQLYTAERLLEDMAAASVDEAVVVGYPIYDWTDNAYVRAVVERYDRLSGIGMVDVFADDAPETVRDLMGVEGMLGIRLGCQFPRDHESMWNDWDASVAWLREAVDREDVWDAVRETDALVQLFVDHSQLAQVETLVAAHPDLPVLVDHWAHVDGADDPGEGSGRALAALAPHENVAIKASATPMVSERGFPHPDLHDHLRWLLEEFGRERVVWGSDFPNVSHPEFGRASYRESRTWLDYVAGLSDADRAWLTGRAFERFRP